MSSSQYPSSRPAGPEDGCEYLTVLPREVAFAAVIAALLLAGVVVGASLAARPEALLVRPFQAPAAVTLEFDYFPSRYVNQGVEPTEEFPTY
jgi:hypothetical protein